MVTLTQQEKEFVDRFRQLPPERQRYVMLFMYRTDPDQWQRFQRKGEVELRKLAAERGLDWDKMEDEERQEFVNGLVHEDRT